MEILEAPSHSAVLSRLLQELDGLPDDELWRVRVFAGLRRVVSERRAAVGGLSELQGGAGHPDAATLATLALLDARSLAAVEASCVQWRRLPHWQEHWFLLGVQDFGKHLRLVPPGRFERFDENMLIGGVDWRSRYGNFMWAARCPSMGGLRLAILRVVQALDLEVSGTEEVRHRLASELHLNERLLTLECVEQLLEDTFNLRMFGGGDQQHDDRSMTPLATLGFSPIPSPAPPLDAEDG